MPKLFAPGLAFACLFLIGFSSSLFVQSRAIVAAKGPEFLLSNQLGTPGRDRLLLGLLLGALVPPFVAAVYVLVRRLMKRRDGLARVITFATLVCPLMLVGLLPALFSWQFAQRATISYLLLLTLFILGFESLLRVSLTAWETVTAPRGLRWLPAGWATLLRRTPGWVPLVVVLLSALAYTSFAGYFTIQQHRHILTSAFDLGIYDNVLFNAYAGHPWHSPVLYGPNDVNYLASHSEYGMLLFLPLYALKPGAETLLLIQAVMLGFAAVPLFLFARTRVSPSIAVVVSWCYLLFAPLHGPNFYDFHWLPLAIFFHFWLYFGLATRRTWLAVLCVLVLLSLREDIAVGLAIFGFFLALTGARVRFGLLLGTLSVVWFGVNKFVIMPSLGTWWFDNMYSELFADGKSSYASVFRTLLSNPVYAATTFVREQKLTYVFQMLAPLAFLPGRRIALVPLLLPGAFFTLLTTAYWPTVSIAFQYTTHWIPYLFLGTVLSLSLLRRGEGGQIRQRAAVGALCLALLSHSHAFGAILQRESFVGGFGQIDFSHTPAQAKRYAELLKVLRLIPADASVAATEYLNPHISARREAFCFRYDLPVVDYILVSSYEVAGDNKRLLKNLVNKASYQLVTTREDFYLFKRGTRNEATEKALRRLGIHL
ncbi:MAG: DUF2079 domain-containing protein [Myxococcales bacterium]|nr:MAG: DUF2079 domain-containing protein [Myxococcales bacterium]